MAGRRTCMPKATIEPARLVPLKESGVPSGTVTRVYPESEFPGKLTRRGRSVASAVSVATNLEVGEDAAMLKAVTWSEGGAR